jgi:hypothetical protein
MGHAIQTINLEGSNLVHSQLTTFGDDIEHIMSPPYATTLEDFANVLHPLPSGLPP